MRRGCIIWLRFKAESPVRSIEGFVNEHGMLVSLLYQVVTLYVCSLTMSCVFSSVLSTSKWVRDLLPRLHIDTHIIEPALSSPRVPHHLQLR
ncbi:hypothetical protein BDR04DRAFT_871538 [Suillus decipiens]|nr:hypothetical protein BDR04DRAFT_871538 [Suillus decipiens]